MQVPANKEKQKNERNKQSSVQAIEGDDKEQGKVDEKGRFEWRRR